MSIFTKAPETTLPDSATYKVAADWHEERGEDNEAAKLRFEAIILDGMPKAIAAFHHIEAKYRRCCGGTVFSKDLVSDAHLYFHGKHWDETYPRDGTEPSVTVECGVALYREHAETYYLFDNDSTCEGYHYGNQIPYGEDMDDFLWRLTAQLDKAAEAAWDDDILTCPTCGYHQHSGDPHDHSDE